MSNARELAQIPSTPSGRRNLIINGAMRVAQRGTSFSSNAGIYTLDRMRRAGSSLTTAVFDVEQSTDSPEGFAYSYKTTTTTAEGSVGASDLSYGVLYKIEAQDLQHLGYSTSSAKSVTVSFYVKSNTTGTYVLNLYNADNVRHIAKTYTISSANTWEYKTLTFAGDTTDGFNNDNGSGLELYFMTGAGSDYTSGTLPATWEDYTAANFSVGQSVQLQNTLNATWQITGLQLEVGTVATEFEHRSFGEELALCQRYYFKNAGTIYGGLYGTSRGFAGAACLPTTMRADPSLSYSGIRTTTGLIAYVTRNSAQYLMDSTSPFVTGLEADAEL
tara:strand:- start:200 stop:1192 length:993 start_codon:yes stop_codon:yes gene_type:complete